MSTPQVGIFSLGDASHSFIEFALRDDAVKTDAVSTVAGIHGPRQTIEGVNFVVGFRPELWRTVAPADTPPNAASFVRELVGPDGYAMPATQSDIFIGSRERRMATCSTSRRQLSTPYNQ